MWFPEQASSFALSVDSLYGYLLAITVFFSGLIFSLILFFAVRYRRKSADAAYPAPIFGHVPLEIAWSVIPLIIVLSLFFWGAAIYIRQANAPKDAQEIFVVGKQWMWKVQHPGGQREINELHVPVNRPVKLILTSEDVIHSFFIPAFRTKMDAVPGRYTSLWFEATKEGEYHLFCAEYCGTKHSRMIGTVYVLSPSAYQNWLAGGVSGETMVQAGERLFNEFSCHTCHKETPDARGPSLHGIIGTTVQLEGGGTAEVDENYLRQSILEPRARLVRGYQALMPTFEGQLTEAQLLQLIAYIKSLTEEKATE